MNAIPMMLDKIRSATGVKGAAKLSSKVASKQAQEQAIDLQVADQQMSDVVGAKVKSKKLKKVRAEDETLVQDFELNAEVANAIEGSADSELLAQAQADAGVSSATTVGANQDQDDSSNLWPILGGLLGLGAIAAAAGGGGSDPVTPTTTVTGALSDASDTGTKGDNKTSDTTPSITGKAPAGSAVKVELPVNGVTKTYTTTAKADGTYEVTIPDADKLPDGTYNPVIVVTPTGGTASRTNATPFTIDTKVSGALADASDTGTKGDNKTTDTTPTIAGVAPAGAAVKVQLPVNGVTKEYTTTAKADGTYEVTIPDADKLPDGTYTPKIVVTPTGGTATTTDATPFTIDTSTTVAISSVVKSGNLDPITGTSEPGNIVTLKDVNGAVIGSAPTDANGNWTVVPKSAVPAGKISATTTDASGNTASADKTTDSKLPNGGNALGLKIDTDANDDGFVNYTEMGNNGGTPLNTLAVSATFDKTLVAVGDVITFTDTNTNTVKTVTLTATDIAAGKVSTSFSGQGDGTTFAVKAVLKDANNSVTPDATDSTTLDLSYLNPVNPRNPDSKSGVVVSISTDTNNDGVLNASEIGTSKTADVTLSLPTDARVGDLLVVNATGNDAQTIVLTAAQVLARQVVTQVTLPANGSELTVSATVSDKAGNVSNTAQDKAVVNTTPAGAPSVEIITDTNGDGFINRGEIGTDTTVGVKTSLPTGTVAGDTITVTDGTTTKTHVLTSTDISNGFVTDTFSKPAEGSTINISATRTPSGAGSTSPAGTDSAKLDTSNFVDPNDATKSAVKVAIDTDANNDGLISSSELAATSQKAKATITLPTTAAAGDTLTVKASGNTDKVITLTAADIAAGKVVVSDLTATADNTTFTVSASIKDQAGNTSPNPDGSDTANIKTSVTNAPSVSIAEDTNNDGTIGADELSGKTDISIGLPTGAQANDKLKITINGNVETYTLTAADISNGAIARSVDASNGTAVQVKATLTDAAGNTSAEGSDSATVNTTVDPRNATATVAISSISNDSGVSTSDFYTNDQTLSYTGTVTSFNTDTTDVVFLQLQDNTGAVVASTTVRPSNGTWTWDNTGVTRSDGNYTLVATITDSTAAVRRNSSAGGQKSQVLTVDTSKTNNSDPTDGKNKPATDPNDTSSTVINIASISEDRGSNTSDFITSDQSLVYGGTISNWTNNGDQVKLELKQLSLASDGVTITGRTTVGSTFVVPSSTGAWTWDNTAVDSANGRYELVATVVDKAGNELTPKDTQLIVIDNNTDNANASVDITAISVDSGTSASDFYTNDQTLSYSGTVNGFTANGDKVYLELKNASGTVVASALVDPVNGAWSWDNTGVSRADGNYTLSATVTDKTGTLRRNSAVGGQDSQVLTVDTDKTKNTENDDATDGNKTPQADPNDSKTLDITGISNDTGSSTTDFKTSDTTLSYSGTVSGWTANGDAVLLELKNSAGTVIATTTVVPNSAGAWTWDNTAVSRSAGTYTLAATAIDRAGNALTPKDTQTIVITGPNGGEALGVIITTDTNDDGWVNYSEIGNTGGTPNTTLNVSASFNKAEVSVGDIVTFTDADTGTTESVTLTAALIAAGKVTTSFTSPGDGKTFTVKAVLKDADNVSTPEGADQARLDLSYLDPVSPNNPNSKSRTTVGIKLDTNNDGILNGSEVGTATTTQVEIGLPTDARAGDTLLVTGTGNADQSITLTAADITAGKVTTTLNLPSNGSRLDVTAKVSDAAGNVSNTATDSASVSTTPAGAPTVEITTDTNGDGFINRSEIGAATTVAVKTTLPGATAVGDVIKVTDGTTEKTHTITQADIDAGFVTDTFTKPAEGGTINISATRTPSGGGSTSAAGTDSAKLDTSNFVDPSDSTKTGVGIKIDTDANNDGFVGGSELSATTGLMKVTVTLPAGAAVGDTVTVKASGNTDRTFTLTSAQVTAGKIVITDFNPTTENTTFNVSASIRDAAGNTSPTPDAKDSAMIKTTTTSAPTVTVSEDANNDGFISASELSGDVNVSIALPTGAKAGDKILVSANGGTPVEVVLTAADITRNSVSTTVPAPAEGETVSVAAILVDEAGNSSPEGKDSAVRDTIAPNGGAAPTVVITTDSNNDGFVNSTELNGAGTFAVKGSFDKTKVAVGDKVVFSNGTSTNTVTLTQTDIDNGFATSTFSKPTEGGTLTVTAVVADAAGNTTTRSASDSATLDTTGPTQVVTGFSSMTKDTGLASVTTDNTSANANWKTADASAGRLVSGSLSQALTSTEVLEVFVNKGDGAGAVKIGNAVTNGTHWAVTDNNSYATTATSNNWTYSARVTDTAGNFSTTKTQVVTGDYTEEAPVITSVKDAAGVSLADGASTEQKLTTVTGTGNAGDTIFLYDNSYSNVVGTAVVSSTGTWTVTLGTGVAEGSNAFAAKQVDTVGNESVFSNIWNAQTPGTNLLTNGDFESGTFGVGSTLTQASENVLVGGNNYGYTNEGLFKSSVALSTYTTTSGTYSLGTWSKLSSGHVGLADPFMGAGFDGHYIFGQITNTSAANPVDIWKQSVSVVSGMTYTFQFDFSTSDYHGNDGPIAVIDGVEVNFYQKDAYSAGHVWITYNATTTKTIDLKMIQKAGAFDGYDWAFDNFQFNANPGASDGSLGLDGATPNADNLTFNGGAISALASADMITASSTTVQAQLQSGGRINGGAGADTLKLAAGTVLDVELLTRNQTVKSIQEVEIFQLQGASVLTLSANDVLSLGGSNASTMSAFSFNGTTSGTGTGFDSTGKVQFVVKARDTDTVNLTRLRLDGVLDAAGTDGNTGLAGQWNDIGLVAIGGISYQVFNHSTTQAQVLVSNANVVRPTADNRIFITSVEANSTSFTETFNDGAASGTTNTKYTSADGAWTIEATGIGGGALDATRGHVVGSYSPWAALGPDKHLILGDQRTNTAPGRENTFTSNFGEFDKVAMTIYAMNATTSYINFYDSNGNFIHTTGVGAAAALTNFTYTLPSNLKAKSFKIFVPSDEAWGLDDLTVSLNNATTIVSAGGGSIDRTPIIKGTYSANLAVDEEIQVFDGTTLLGTATIEPNSHTWSFQVPTAASIGSHSYSVKIVDGAGVATALSTAYSVNVLSTPLALDLNGDGVQTTTLADGASFDLTADGSANAVSWIDHHDGFLALDRNGDGVINDGSELFGGATQLADGSIADDGWAALAQFDLNGDQLIDAKDAIYKDLKVWVDANGNGGTGEGELKSLEDLGIASINLNHDANQVAQNGNILQGFSSFTTIDGQEHQIVDAWLQVGNTVEDLVANSEFTAIEAPVTPVTGTEILNPVLDTTAVTNVLADQQLVQHTI